MKCICSIAHLCDANWAGPIILPSFCPHRNLHERNQSCETECAAARNQSIPELGCVEEGTLQYYVVLDGLKKRGAP